MGSPINFLVECAWNTADCWASLNLKLLSSGIALITGKGNLSNCLVDHMIPDLSGGETALTFSFLHSSGYKQVFSRSLIIGRFVALRSILTSIVSIKQETMFLGLILLKKN